MLKSLKLLTANSAAKSFRNTCRA